MSFLDKLVVISGGNNGIGKETLQQFNDLGAKTVVIDKEEAMVECNYYYQGDLSKKEVLDDFLEEFSKRYSKVDVLVNNACFSNKGILSGCNYESFLEVIKVGLVTPYYLSLKLKNLFSKDSSIINIASTRAFMSQPDTESYSSAKGGIVALTHALAASLAGKVRVNVISPGWIDNSQSTWSEADYEQHFTRTIGTPEDIANMVLFLASDKARFINGENIIIDGGMTKNMIYHNDYNWVYKKEGE